MLSTFQLIADCGLGQGMLACGGEAWDSPAGDSDSRAMATQRCASSGRERSGWSFWSSEPTSSTSPSCRSELMQPRALSRVCDPSHPTPDNRFKHLSKVEKEYMMREVQTMHTISKGDGHPYLVRLRQSFVDGSMLAIIMDYCDSGDLQQRIAAQRPLGWYFDERTVQAWLAQLLSAVDFLHHSKILHRDIKPANIFMNGEDTLKLGDLGLSKCSQAATSAQKHTQCGSPLYLAPEVHLGMEYSKSVDMCESAITRAAESPSS